MIKELLNETIVISENIKNLISENKPEMIEDALYDLHKNISIISDCDSELLKENSGLLISLNKNIKIIDNAISALKTINTRLLKIVKNEHLTYTKD